MNVTRLLVILFSCTIFTGLIAQEKGFLRGNIEDGDFGGPLIGATIIDANNPSLGTVSDFDGNFSLSLDPGTYTIQISFISYQSQTFENIIITAGEATVLDAVMKGIDETLEEVVVVAKASRSSDIGMLSQMKNSSNVVDGLSSQTFRKIGDSDLSGAIKRVTGVTVEGGKYVYVRGLGDRYTKTTLNDMSIPGLDPDVNAVQIDIFPTSVLENVAVYKTLTPNLYGDFSGGLVNVVTKSFPDEKSTSITIGGYYTQGQTFNNDYIRYDGGSLDFLGFDDGTRKLPFNKNTVIPVEVENNPALETITRSFERQLATQSKTAYPGLNLSFNHGNQINKDNGATWGYNFVLNYQLKNYFYENFETNVYLKPTLNDADNELQLDEERLGNVGGQNVMWSLLGSAAYKKNTNSFELMLLHSQSGESTASDRISQNRNQTQARLLEDILTYTQRQLSTAIINGSHMLNNTEIKWSNALTLSRVYDPDFRSTALSILSNPADTTLNAGDGAGINRFWRDLNETNENLRLDVSIPLNSQFKLKAGGNMLLKWRKFETFQYNHDRRNRSDIVGDPDWFLQPDNIWMPAPPEENTEGTYTRGNFEPANNFDAKQNIYGGYAMAEAKLGAFKLIFGARVELAQMFYTGQNNAGSEIYDNQKTLDELNVLPSLNVVWGINDRMNLRGSFNLTVARPSFREKSIAQIFDPISKRTFIGNINLNQTNVTNYDLRYEFFPTPGEVISVAAFYKTFDGHIELVAFETAPDNLTPRNSGNASVYGTEVEIRKRFLNWSSLFFQRLFIGGNVTFVRSAVDTKSVNTGDQGQTEFELRQANARSGETIDQFRPMAGQSPYAVNANISYENSEKKHAVSLAFNVKGEQLSIIASGRVPDVYTLPFNSLDFNFYYSFGAEYQHRITFSVDNILDDDRILVYRSYGASDQTFSRFKPGRTFSIKYSIDL